MDSNGAFRIVAQYEGPFTEPPEFIKSEGRWCLESPSLNQPVLMGFTEHTEFSGCAEMPTYRVRNYIWRGRFMAPQLLCSYCGSTLWWQMAEMPRRPPEGAVDLGITDHVLWFKCPTCGAHGDVTSPHIFGNEQGAVAQRLHVAQDEVHGCGCACARCGSLIFPGTEAWGQEYPDVTWERPKDFPSNHYQCFYHSKCYSETECTPVSNAPSETGRRRSTGCAVLAGLAIGIISAGIWLLALWRL